MNTLLWICVVVIAVCLTYIFTERYTVWKMFKLLDAVDDGPESFEKEEKSDA